jgi:hypothetical protein
MTLALQTQSLTHLGAHVALTVAGQTSDIDFEWLVLVAATCGAPQSGNPG